MPQRNRKDTQRMIDAARDGDEAILAEALADGADVADAGADVADAGAKSLTGWTAIASAAAHGHETRLRILIAAGADIDARDNDGWTMAMFAGLHGHGPRIQTLIDAGADLASDNGHPELASLIEAAILSAFERSEMDRSASPSAATHSSPRV